MADASKYPSVLRDLQEAITNRLSGCSALAGIDVYDRRKGEIEDAIKVQLASIGITIFVGPVKLRNISPDVPNVSSDLSDFTVRIFENPTTNSTGRDSAAAREIVMRRLNHFDPGIEGCGVITIDPDPEDDGSVKNQVISDLLFHISVTLEAGID